MNTLAKILVTALIVVIAFFLSALAQGWRQMQGFKGGGGILGGIVLFGAYYAIRAVWKKDDKKGDKDDDSSVILQK